MPLFKKLQGGALLTALFIMTLVAIVATAMSTRLQLDIYRTRLIITYDKLFLASQAVRFWALNQLNDQDIQYTKLNNQGMVDKYPKNMGALVNQVKLSGGLYDLQARFNLNNLSETKMMPVFNKLVSHASPNMNTTDRQKLTLVVNDWLTPYDLALGTDDYTSYYLSQKPSYYPSHLLMNSTSEFRLIKDVTSSLCQSMEPFITALPEITPLNINTASKKVLMSLGKGLREEDANEIIIARGEYGIKNLKDIEELTKKIGLPNEQITIDSKYFLSVAYASSDEFKLVVYTLLKRNRDKNGKLTVSIVRESINNF
jgi:general secretion pathway protein K